MSKLRELGESIESTVLDGIGKASASVQERKPLPVDLLESEESFLAVFDAPGIDAPDVAVRFENGVLFVHVDRFREFHDGYEMRLPGRGMSLESDVALPEAASVDPAASTATVTSNGTLRVELPKSESSTKSKTEATEGPTDLEVGGDTDDSSLAHAQEDQSSEDIGGTDHVESGESENKEADGTDDQ
jgi:HSP20 family molecular chaperone IbpA